jgi:Asparagine synthase
VSWIFGLLSRNLTPNLAQKGSAIHSEALRSYVNGDLYIAYGGIGETCSAGVNTPEAGWVVAGLGLSLKNESVSMLSNSDWQHILTRSDPLLDDLDGHFVVVRWTSSKVECFNDQLGLRTLYIGNRNGEVCFSTRLDWISRFTGHSEIDFEVFGSRWLTFNMLSDESPVRGIQKLGPRGRATITSSSFTNQGRPWLPEVERKSVSATISTLKSFTQPMLSNGYSISLGLSGGIDSRVLLSLLQSNKRTPFSVHTFGHANDPDVRIAADIAKHTGIEAHYLSAPIPPPEECLRLMCTFAAQAQIVEPVSSILPSAIIGN